MTAAMRLLHSSGSRGPDSLSLVGLLLTPVAVAAGALAAWRLGVDAGWTRTFFIARGFLSHWQVWCAFAVSAEICACSLRRSAVKLESGIPAIAHVRATL
jgi:hypothetical protein